MNKELREALKKGNYPLLPDFQLQLLEEVSDCIFRVNDDGNWYTSDEHDISQVHPEIPVLKENVFVIIERLNFGRLAKLRFIATYEEFKENRDNCIKHLTEIALSLHSDRFKCNVSKLVGYCASLVGGTVTLASAILIPFTFGGTTPLAIAGGVATATGAATAVGTSVTEVARLKSKLDQAKSLIEQDAQYLDSMSDWLEHAKDLEEAIESVRNSSILKDVSENIKKFVERAVTIKKNDERLEYIKKTVKHLLILLQPKYGSVPISVVATVLSLSVTVFLLLLNFENRLVFDCASVTIKTIVGVACLVDSSMKVIHLPSILSGNAAVGKHFAKAVTRGTVAIINIALDVVGIVQTSVDIHKGSLSPEAGKIAEAARNMRIQADVLEKINEGLSQT